MVIFPIMLPQFLRTFKNFELRQIIAFSRHLSDPSSLLSTHITKIMVLAVVHIQLLYVVEILLDAKPAIRMLLCDMRLQRSVLVQCLLKQQDRFILDTKFAEVNFVRIHIVFTKLLGLSELLKWVFLHVDTQAAVQTYLSFDVSPDLLSCEYQVIALVLYFSSPI